MSIGLGVNLALRSGGQGEPLNPVITGLVGQYDFGSAANLRNATDGSGSPVTNTQEIKWVRDLSGNGKHLILSTASGPTWQANTYNGRGCGRFNANALSTATNVSLTATNECTMIFMGNISSVAGLAIILVATTNYTTAGSNWYGISGAGVGPKYKLEASGANIDMASAILPCNDSKLHCFSAACAGGATPLRSLRCDGTAEFTDSAGAAYTINDNIVSVGGWNTANYFVGDCVAALVYNRKLTQGEMSQVELWLADLYGLNISGVTWPLRYNPIQRASIHLGTLNANQLGTSVDPLKYDFDAEDIDELGTANASLTDLATIATWANKGAAAGGGDATQGTDANRPIVQKNLTGTRDAVVFGGNFDILNLTGSQADLGFIHNANTHEIWLVGRKDLASRQVMFSNTELTSEKGFLLDFDSNGKAHYQRYNGAATISTNTVATATPVGGNFVLRAYAYAGNNTGISEYPQAIASAGANAAAVGAGDATNVASIGALAETASGSFDGAIYRILVFNGSITDTTVRDNLASYLQSLYGVA